MVQIHAISIQLHLLHTKDTESHEDSDFCYDWGGVRMCEFCKNIAMDNDEYYEKRYAGGDFIFKDENGFGVLIDTGDSGCLGYIKINYCPLCGRKLVG